MAEIISTEIPESLEECFFIDCESCPLRTLPSSAGICERVREEILQYYKNNKNYSSPLLAVKTLLP